MGNLCWTFSFTFLGCVILPRSKLEHLLSYLPNPKSQSYWIGQYVDKIYINTLPAPAPPPFGPLGPRPGSLPVLRPARNSPLPSRSSLRPLRLHHVTARQTEGDLQVWSALDRLRHELERAARQALSPGAGQLRGGVQQQGGPGRGSEPGWRGAGPGSPLSGPEPRPQDPPADLP